MSARTIINSRDTESAIRQRRLVGERLRTRREKMGISRAELAEVVGVTEKGFGHYETGHSEMVPSKLSKIAGRLGVTTSYLLGDDTAEELEQEDRDIIRYLHNMPPELRASARAAVRAMHDANARAETTHGKKAE